MPRVVSGYVFILVIMEVINNAMLNDDVNDTVFLEVCNEHLPPC